MITAIVLTFNESKHIERCISSLLPFVQRIVVVDSFSTDNTREIAASMGADVLQKAWLNHATQFNWALDHAHIQTDWVLRIDADETATSELAEIIVQRCESTAAGISGLTLNRQIHFLGRWIRHGGIYPIRSLRLFRFGKGRCEQRWMDEHIVVDGGIDHIDADIVDENLNDLTGWTDKHNGYASREVVDVLLNESDCHPEGRKGLSRQARAKRWLKYSVYARLPFAVGPMMYFFYRYILRFGFLDGRQGLIFHMLQGFWYRFLVDAKLHEIHSLIKSEGLSKPEAIERMYRFRV